MREMKDSGIEWIGAIPVSWSTIKNKYIFRLRSGEAISKEALIDEGLYPVYGGGERIGYYNKYNVSSNSFLIGRVGARCGCVTPVNSLCWATDNALIAEIDDINDYYTYALIAANLNRLNESNAQPLITATKVLNVSIPKPDKKEQLFIAEFLNNRSNECDTLIIDIQSQIEALEEYKRSVITEAVTKGIDPDVEMRDSGIDAFELIPNHWEVLKIKWLLRERNERSVLGEEEPLSMSQKFGIISTSQMDIIPNMASSFVGAKITHIDDLVFNKLKAHLGVFAVSKYYGLVSPDYAVYFTSGKSIVKYLEFLFKTDNCISEFKRRSTGVGAGLTRLYTSDLFDIKVPIPPIQEQQQIADYLDGKCAEIDSIIAEKKQQIETIEEYKKSLIFEYVTGKKEVQA